VVAAGRAQPGLVGDRVEERPPVRVGRAAGGAVLDQRRPLGGAVAAPGVLEVDQRDPGTVAEEVGQVVVLPPEDGRHGRVGGAGGLGAAQPPAGGGDGGGQNRLARTAGMAVEQRPQARQAPARVSVRGIQPGRLVRRYGGVQPIHGLGDGGQLGVGQRPAAERPARQPAHRHRGRVGGEVGRQRSGSEAGGVPIEQAQAEPFAPMLAAVVRAEPLDDDVRNLDQVGGHGE
jgi:hypothetical protein